MGVASGAQPHLTGIFCCAPIGAHPGTWETRCRESHAEVGGMGRGQGEVPCGGMGGELCVIAVVTPQSRVSPAGSASVTPAAVSAMAAMPTGSATAR